MAQWTSLDSKLDFSICSCFQHISRKETVSKSDWFPQKLKQNIFQMRLSTRNMHIPLFFGKNLKYLSRFIFFINQNFTELFWRELQYARQ